MNDLKKKENESLLSYIKRITDNRTLYDLDYAEWAKLVCNKDYSSDNARKSYYIIKPMLDRLENEEIEKLPKNKIQEIAEIIGELDIKKQEIKNKTSQFNKIKRNFIKAIEISNDIKDMLREEIHNFEKLNYEPILQTSENKLIIQLSDFHVGYVINDYKGNTYNYEVAKERLSILISEAYKKCQMYNITDVVVVNNGDSIENLYMRDNQSYDCEFNLNEQIVYATKLLYGFCTSVSDFANVEFVSVGGNHNRGNGSKNANVEGDNSNIIIVEMFKDFVQLSNNNRITVREVDYKDDSAVFELCGKKIKVVHGDNRVSESKKLFDGEATMDGEEYYIILRGHYHNFNISSQNGGYVITCGCLFGLNPYSVKRMSCTTNASQTLIVMNENGIEDIKNVILN